MPARKNKLTIATSSSKHSSSKHFNNKSSRIDTPTATMESGRISPNNQPSTTSSSRSEQTTEPVENFQVDLTPATKEQQINEETSRNHHQHDAPESPDTGRPPPNQLPFQTPDNTHLMLGPSSRNAPVDDQQRRLSIPGLDFSPNDWRPTPTHSVPRRSSAQGSVTTMNNPPMFRQEKAHYPTKWRNGLAGVKSTNSRRG